MSLKYVTEERANWRKNIKESVSKLYAEALKENPNESLIKEQVTFLLLSLNPQKEAANNLDLKIADLLKRIESKQRDGSVLNELRECISILLKHDWERSKNETKGFFSKDFDENIKAKYLGEFYEPEQKADRL
ncbi:hypothetical protein D3C73_1351050 [compost metagenome]